MNSRTTLKHIVLCVNPLVQVFGIGSTMIEQNFGTTDAPGRSYDQLLVNYLEKLNQGRKAPDPYLPEIVLENEKSELLKTLPTLIEKLNTEIDVFTEKELDTLSIPHPLWEIFHFGRCFTMQFITLNIIRN